MVQLRLVPIEEEKKEQLRLIPVQEEEKKKEPRLVPTEEKREPYSLLERSTLKVAKAVPEIAGATLTGALSFGTTNNGKRALEM
jgi:hypothetical protein